MIAIGMVLSIGVLALAPPGATTTTITTTRVVTTTTAIPPPPCDPVAHDVVAPRPAASPSGPARS